MENTNLNILTKLAGILHVSSKSVTKNGITKIGVCRKEFTPFVKNLPNFTNLPKIMVKTTKMNTAPDEYVIVRFEKMEGNIMYCEVDQYLGQIGGYQMDLLMTKSLACCHWTNKYNKEFVKLATIDLCSTRIDMTNVDLPVYSIDPAECEDIDDALHVIKYSDHYEIGIHIADVTSFIEFGNTFDVELSKRVETLYFDNDDMEIIHMIPQSLSINFMSLKSNSAKRTFSVIIKTDLDCKILSVEFKRLLVNIKQNLSYEQAQNLIQTNEDLANLYNVGNQLKSTMPGSFGDSNNTANYDTHQMVEIYMVLANKLVAEKIKNTHENSVFLRSQPTSEIAIVPTNNIISVDSQKILARKSYICNLERAKYQIGTENCRHSSLNLEYYTHFTSPMRRYADIIVHRQLESCIKTSPIIVPNNSTICLINFYSNFYKQIARYSNLVHIVNNLDNISEFDANIVSIRNGNNCLRLFVPNLNLDYDYQIINNKFKHLIEFENENNMLVIKNITNNNSLQFELFQQVKVKIAKLDKSMEKITMTIIDPDISFILGIN